MNARRMVIAGGCGLAFGASFANTGLLLATGTSVSHLTGDIAKLSADLARWSPALLTDTMRVGLAAFSFLLGALVSGALIHHPTFDFSRPYGRTVTAIGFLLIVSSLIVDSIPLLSIALAAFSCGLQNALAAHYRGIVLRTTHLTGLFTDLGTTVGMRLRGYLIPMWKIAVPALLIVSFFFGGLTSAFLHFYADADTIFDAGVAYCAAGMAWSFWKRTGTRCPEEKG